MDEPKPGGSGNKNNGNTARRDFEYPNELAKHFKLDCELLHNFETISTSMSS